MSQNDHTCSRERLVQSPVFILSPPRSGSTLLRVLLNSHSMIRSPHELYLGDLEVNLSEFRSAIAMKQLGLGRTELEYLLWDRLLHHELILSGKQLIIEKTPANALVWRRIHECWPAARYIFLLRHPGSVHASLFDYLSRGFVDGVRQMVAEQLQDGTAGWELPVPAMQDTEPAGKPGGVQGWLMETMLEFVQGGEAGRKLPVSAMRDTEPSGKLADVRGRLTAMMTERREEGGAAIGTQPGFLSLVKSDYTEPAGKPGEAGDPITRMAFDHIHGVDEAMRVLPGLTVRYEDLVENPAKVTREVCSFLGVPWEQQMLEYGKRDHGLKELIGVGDVSANIRSGEIREPRALPRPEAIPEELRDVCRAWGYIA
jgi:hypothetical protein